jgi:hypothetical protein
MLDSGTWDRVGLGSDWDEYLGEAATAEESNRLREATLTGRPWGGLGCVRELEAKLDRPLQSKGRGRPKKHAAAAGS